MSRPRILIVGGVAGGASAAARARRMNERARIILFEKGENVSFANCGLPYHVGGRIERRDKLLVTSPEILRQRLRIDVRTRHEVVRIDRQAAHVEVVNHVTGEKQREPYDKLILSPGASPIVPPWNGSDRDNVFTLRDLADMDRIKTYLDQRRPKRAVVIGAGFIGLEMVEALVERGLEVSVVELQRQVLPPLDAEMAREIERELRGRSVGLHLGAGVDDLVADGASVTAVRLADGRELPADLVLISIGVRPMTELAREAGLTIGSTGAIAVNAHLQTNDPNIYAVGDAAEVRHAVTGAAARIPLAGPANRNGRLAGEHAATGESVTAPPPAGTAVVGVFGKTAAMTGLSTKAAQQADLPHKVAYAIRGHHVGYYPGAEGMILELIYDPGTGRVLGAQAVGGAGVDKRIDVLAAVIRLGGTIDDVAGLDLAYAPPYGAAKDPVHIAAFVAQNERAGLLRQLAPGDSPIDGKLVDVREPGEFAAGTLPGAINVPLGTLRDHLDRWKKDDPVIVFCQVGQRGYYAARILMQHGFKEVWNLAGGYRLHG